MADRLLLADGSSLLLLADGSSKLLLAGSPPDPRSVRIPRAHHPVRRRFEGRPNRHFRLAASRIASEVYVPTVPHYGGVTGPAAVAGTAPRWRVRIVGFDHTGKGELPSAVVDGWSETLNGLSEVRFTFSGSDPAMSEFQAGTRWVEVWLDGDLKFRGYPVRVSYSFDRQTYTVQCFDHLWPFTQRVFGRADVPNLLANGGFEDGTGSWTEGGTVTFTADTAIVNEGSKSGKLVGSGRIFQTFNIRHTYPPGLLYRLALDCYEPTTSTSPVGSVVAKLSITDPETGIEYQTYAKSTEGRGGWISLTADMFVAKANVTYAAAVTLYGQVTVGRWFDRVRVNRNEATTVAFPGEDQATAYRKVIEYGQDSSQGQSALGIATNCAATGVTVMVGWAHADHRGLMSAVDELTQRPDGPDWALVYTPGSSTFTTYHPSKGSTHNEWLLEVGRNVAGGSVEVDVTQVKTSAIVIGDTASFERDEGGHVDTSQMSGLILTDVSRAEPGTPTRFLDELAEERVDARKQLVAIPRLTVTDPDRELIHSLEVGDTIPVRLAIGLTQVDGRANYRVVGKTVPATADRVALDLIPVPV